MAGLGALKNLSWKQVTDVMTAIKLVDMGHLLSWNDGRQTLKVLGDTGSADLVRHIALRLGERYSDRLSSEILIESLYALLVASNSERLMVVFLEELFNSVEFNGVTRQLVEISLGGEVPDDDFSKSVVAAAVALICEIGLNIKRLEDERPGHIDRSKSLSDHIAAYLLSVSNTNIQAVRLSLLRYFSQIEYGHPVKLNYTKLMTRFGHSIMESLFQQLFVKKSEKVAAQFLLENLPCALESVGETQRILHETFKQHMFKESERFCLFIHELGSHLMAISQSGVLCPAAESYAKHLVALYKVTSDLGHRDLGREVLQELYRFAPYGDCGRWIRSIETSNEIRRIFRDMATDYRVKIIEAGKSHKVISQFRMSKRGRKPSISKGDFSFLEQVMTLGEYEVRHSA